MFRKIVLAATAGALIVAPATASAGTTAYDGAAPTAEQVAINTGSGAADVVINGLIAAIFGPNDPSTCKFPYCF
ncbi:hypothetical protein [Nocardia nova]|uniref:hypothetical protein n=1 Tax=Nocardia nova TaxID=37330 RepID=UPI0033DA45C8